ncbi:MAG: DUF929 family protein [Candidatus Micrarchaeia archaeon]
MEGPNNIEGIKKEEKSIEVKVSDIQKNISVLQIIAVVLVLMIVGSVLFTYFSVSGLNAKINSLSSVQPVQPSKLPQANNSANYSAFGTRLTNIDKPFNNTELAAINNEPNSYFEQAGEMVFNTSPGNPFGESYKNGSYIGAVFLVKHMPTVSTYVVNGKPSVIYLGAISCAYCSENKWAMALALSRFGSFNNLYTGYGSFGDGDIPTVYWSQDNYTSKGSATYGNKFSSNLINFLSIDYDSQITGGFQFPPGGVSYFINIAPNSTYKNALILINKTGMFVGTPFSIWGNVVQGGADATVFGTQQPGQPTNLPPISYMTHGQILSQLSSFNTTFAKEEYAAADVYIAELCPSLNNTPSICSQPAIQKMENIIFNAS